MVFISKFRAQKNGLKNLPNNGSFMAETLGFPWLRTTLF